MLARGSRFFIEKGSGEVITAPVIRAEIPGGRVQISGSMTTTEAADIALLLRAGSLAAPMEIIEERLIGPSLGADNIAQGFNSTLWGFVAIVIFIIAYYFVFGMVSALSLLKYYPTNFLAFASSGYADFTWNCSNGSHAWNGNRLKCAHQRKNQRRNSEWVCSVYRHIQWL